MASSATEKDEAVHHIQMGAPGSVEYDYIVCFSFSTRPVREFAWVVLLGADLSSVETKSIAYDLAAGKGEILSLKDAVKTFEEYVTSKLGIGPENYCVVVNGERVLRDSFRLECEDNGVRFPKELNRFFDVQAEFVRKFGPPVDPANLHNFSAMLQHMGVTESPELLAKSAAVREASGVAMLFTKLIQAGHQLHTPITVPHGYKPQRQPEPTVDAAQSGSGSNAAPQSAILRLTGLAPEMQPSDIIQMLTPIKVLNGAAGVLGLPSVPGEAFVILEAASDLPLALQKAAPPVNINRSSQEELQRFLYGSQPPAQSDQTKPSDADEHSNTIIRIRGLPYDCRTHDVADFFSGLKIANDGIHIMYDRSGRTSGEAYIVFETESDSDAAVRHYHKRHMGRRYIEVFNATPSEFRRALEDQQKRSERAPQGPPPPRYSSAPPPRSIGGTGFVARMRGIPWSAKQSDIADFFHGIQILPNGIHMTMDHLGRPGGECFVEFPDEKHLELALKRNRDMIGNRYVELFRATSADISNLTDLGETKHREKRDGGRRDYDRDRGFSGRDRDARDFYESRDPRDSRDYDRGGYHDRPYDRNRDRDDRYRDYDRGRDRDYDRGRPYEYRDDRGPQPAAPLLSSVMPTMPAAPLVLPPTSNALVAALMANPQAMAALASQMNLAPSVASEHLRSLAAQISYQTPNPAQHYPGDPSRPSNPYM